MPLANGVNWLDSRQRSRSVLGFPLAVWLKYSEDQGRYLGAIVTYYAFFSLFPLLLVHALTGNGVALGVGLTLALWAGNRVFIAAGSVMDHIWGIPPRRQPGFFGARLRALLLGLALGSGVVGTSALNAFGTVGPGHALLWRIGSFTLSTAANIALFWLAFRLLTADQVSWRQLRGGAVLAALAWELLLAAGSLYVHHVVAAASNTYGTFAGVIGLL